MLPSDGKFNEELRKGSHQTARFHQIVKLPGTTVQTKCPLDGCWQRTECSNLYHHTVAPLGQAAPKQALQQTSMHQACKAAIRLLKKEQLTIDL